MSNKITRRKLIKQGALGMMAYAMPGPVPFIKMHNYMKVNKHYDGLIIGGSYAGLSAAMALGRSLRNVLIIDGGKPCNRYTPHAHNFLTHDGDVPADIAQHGKAEVLKYDTVSFLQDIVLEAERIDSGFQLMTKSGKVYTSKKLLFATGLSDIMPDIEGFEACWGKSVIHCPYCHGYEYHHRPTGIMANDQVVQHLAPLVNNLTGELYVFTNGKSTISTEQTGKIKKHNIRIIEDEIDYLDHTQGKLNKVVLKNSNAIDLDALYAHPEYKQHCPIPEQLGCELTEQGLLQVDMFQKTSVEGVYAAGDNCAMRSIATAVFTGNVAGAICNKDIAEEEF